MFYRRFADKGDNPVNYSNIYKMYSIKGDNTLSGSTTRKPELCFSSQFYNCLFYNRNSFVVFNKTKIFKF